jgi:hypothetical protein
VCPLEMLEMGRKTVSAGSSACGTVPTADSVVEQGRRLVVGSGWPRSRFQRARCCSGREPVNAGFALFLSFCLSLSLSLEMADDGRSMMGVEMNTEEMDERLAHTAQFIPGRQARLTGSEPRRRAGLGEEETKVASKILSGCTVRSAAPGTGASAPGQSGCAAVGLLCVRVCVYCFLPPSFA